MKLTLLKGNVIYTSVLPEKQKGQYWVTQRNDSGYEERVMSVEGVENTWILKSNKNAIIQDSNSQRIKEIVIEPLEVYRILFTKSNEVAHLYAEPISDDRKSFQKLLLPIEGKLIIGRSEDCDIRFASKYASSRHAELVIQDERISIRNMSNSNGTYVNGNLIVEKVLDPGDMIYIIGLTLVIGNGFIAINNPDGLMTYNKSIIKPFQKQQIELLDDESEIDDDDEVSAVKTFFRSPRFKREINKPEINIDPPPSPENRAETPLLLMLGPSITMGLASLFSALFSLQYAFSNNGNIRFAIPMLVMSLSMLTGAILWPILTRRYERKKRNERESLRQVKYKEYLDEVRSEIAHEIEQQSEVLHENFIQVNECVDRIINSSSKLWERTRDHHDFLELRIGLGNILLEAEIKYPEKKFTLEDDNLQEELHRLAEEPKEIKQVPITLTLSKDRISGVIGSRNHVINFAKSLILQLVALHSYDEMKLVFVYDKKEQDIWDFIKWLPHVWDKEGGMRFIATNPNELKELSAFFESEIEKRANTETIDELNECTPYYVIFAMDKNLAIKAEMLNSIYKQKKNYGFSVINFYDQLVNLPKECSIVIEINEDQSKVYDKNDITGQFISLQPEVYMKKDEQKLAVTLANTQLVTSESDFLLPNMLTFLDMFEVGKIEHLNALTRWKENDPTVNLEAPIGVNTRGEWFYLDLHERFHGPHGLIAGMTGSGKSEFIMTYILSLAVNYHPYEVAFILIDYKGGGMANTFTKLPHLAGTITNLDGAAVNRSLISIQSELKRRQAIFSETGRKLDESNIDIYKYQKLFREGKVDEPLQHLFIISDEFAELKTQQPEFMEQLISAARIGRSLGIHLILATQKPSGVVDDQIWSNSKFRISLKVQEKADSMDVIKRPDAAELSVTGRFYLQVGFNELFELGQSAWGGAPYYPSDRMKKQQQNSVIFIDNLGRILKESKMDKRKSLNQKPGKQIDEITKYLETIAKEEKISIRPIWLEPIPEIIYINEIRQKYNVNTSSKFILNPVIGEIDDPENQRQFEMTFPLTSEGNAIVYGAAGSGKTTFLTTLIYSLMEEHTPSEVNLYILDFSAETLRAFSKAPHIGDVLLSDEAEKINNLFKMLYKEIEERKKLFSDYGGDYQSYIQATGETMASIVVIIHNYSGFAETYEEKEEAIAYLTREGLKYGIYFVMTALNTGAVRYRILQNFKQIFVLQLNDQSDYSGVLGNVNGVYPSKFKGRGIFKQNRVYEFQIAHVFYDVQNTLVNIRKYCDDYANRWQYSFAKKIPILPENVNANYLRNEISYAKDDNLPIGIEKHSLNVAYYNFYQSFINLVLSQNCDNANFIQGLTEVLTAKEDSKIIVIDPQHMYERDNNKTYQYIAAEAELEHIVEQLFNLLVERNNKYKDAIELGEEPPTFDRVTCIINSVSSLMLRISLDSVDKLRVLLDKGEKEYNVTFIIYDSLQNLSSESHESWYKSKISLSDGIWIGDGITDQYQLKVKTSNDMYQAIGEDFGYRISRGKVSLVKLLSSVTSDAENTVEV